MQDPKTMTLSQLREMAMTLGVSNYAKLKKNEALEAVLKIISPEEATPEKAEVKAEEMNPAPAKKAAESKKPAEKKASKAAGPAETEKKTAKAAEPEKTEEMNPAPAKKAAESKKPAEKKASKVAKPAETEKKEPGKDEAKSEPMNPAPAKKKASKSAKPAEAEKKSSKAAKPEGSEKTGLKKTSEKGSEKGSENEKDSQKKTSIKKVLEEKKIANIKAADEKKLKKTASSKKAPLNDEPAEAGILDDVSPEELARAEAEAKRAIAKAEAAQFGVELPAGIDSISDLDSGETIKGVLEILAEGYGFIRSDVYMPGDRDIYVSPNQIKRWQIRTGDLIEGPIRTKIGNEKYLALLYPAKINDCVPDLNVTRKRFDSLTPIFPNERIHLERGTEPISMRAMDLFAPVGKGQRGMIVSPPKAGKTTLIKDVAKSVVTNHPEMKIIILLIDERPEEVTDIKESIVGPNVEVAYSTFDELPEHHKRIAEMVLNRAKRLVEHGEDVMILLDSITRLSRAYNLVVAPSGRTLSGGLDPAALYMPKKFFGAARNMREGGSLTILATALIDTGSRMDDVIFEEFKGTGNMEIVLDRKLSEKRIFPAIDILKSGTRMDELLLTKEEAEGINAIRRSAANLKPEEATEKIVDLIYHTRTNQAFLNFASKKIL